MSRHDDAAVRAIRQAAEAWVVRLQDEPGEAERTAFADWLCASPVHVAEYLHAEAAWQALASRSADRTDDLAQLCRAARQADDKVIDFCVAMDRRHEPGVSARSVGRKPETRTRHRRTWWAAAMLAMCAVAGAAAWLLQPVSGQVYATAIGEVRRIPLEDGSTLELNTDSAVKVSYRPGARDIVLRKGEAFVSVAHDRARPLRVLADGVGVQAVGTAFNVRKREDGLQVTVTDGRVAVREAPVAETRWQQWAGRLGLAGGGTPLPPGVPSHVDADQQLDLTLAGQRIAAARIEPADAARWLGWRQGQLEFTRERLDAVVAELNRYSRKRIVVEDAELAGRRISGGFDPMEPETLLRFLRLHGDVQVVTAATGDMAIRRIDDSPSAERKNNRR